MFIVVDEVIFDEKSGNIALFAPGAEAIIEKYKRLPQFKSFDLRFAAARQGNATYIVIGLRSEGRGFDLAIGSSLWSELAAGPTELLLYYDGHREKDKCLIFDWPEESFQSFLDECGNMARVEPSRIHVAEVAAYFDFA